MLFRNKRARNFLGVLIVLASYGLSADGMEGEERPFKRPREEDKEEREVAPEPEQAPFGSRNASEIQTRSTVPLIFFGERFVPVHVYELGKAPQLYDSVLPQAWPPPSEIHFLADPIRNRENTEEDGSNACEYLLEAARRGHLDVMEVLVGRGSVDVNACTSEGLTAMHMAAEGGHVPVIEWLREQHVAMDARDRLGQIPLDYAVRRRRWLAVACLLRHAEQSIYDNQLRILLDNAVEQGHLETIEWLIFRGIPLDRDGQQIQRIVEKLKEKELTLFASVILGGNKTASEVRCEISRLILDSVSVNALSDEGNRALVMSLRRERCAEEELPRTEAEFLLSNEPIELKDHLTSNPCKEFILSVHGAPFMRIKNPKNESLQLSSSRVFVPPPILRGSNESGPCPWPPAVLGGGVSVELEAAFEKIFEKINELNRSFILMVTLGQKERVDQFIKESKCYISSYAFKQALIRAAVAGNIELWLSLYQAVKDLRIPATVSIVRESFMWMDEQSQSNFMKEALMRVAAADNIELFFSLYQAVKDLQLPATVSIIMVQESLALMDQQRQFDFMIALVKHDLSTNKVVESWELPKVKEAQCNALWYVARAIERGHLDIAKLFLCEIVDINVPDEHGNTLLHCAVYYRHLPIAKLLVEAGAIVNACNKWGETPLDLANESYHILKAYLQAPKEQHSYNPFTHLPEL